MTSCFASRRNGPSVGVNRAISGTSVAVERVEILLTGAVLVGASLVDAIAVGGPTVGVQGLESLADTSRRLAISGRLLTH